MRYEINQIIANPFPTSVPLIAMIVIFIVTCTIVNKKVVQNKAFDYANTLLEVCDSLEEDKI